MKLGQKVGRPQEEPLRPVREHEGGVASPHVEALHVVFESAHHPERWPMGAELLEGTVTAGLLARVPR